MTTRFREFELSELDDRELHAYRLGLTTATNILRLHQRQSTERLDNVLQSGKHPAKDLVTAAACGEAFGEVGAFHEPVLDLSAEQMETANEVVARQGRT